jgi:hypothetical protein
MSAQGRAPARHWIGSGDPPPLPRPGRRKRRRRRGDPLSPAILRRRHRDAAHALFIQTAGERGVRPPEATSFETLGLEEAARRVAYTRDTVGGMTPDALYEFVLARWQRKKRGHKKGASAVVSLAALCGGRGAVAIRTANPVFLDEGFAFKFPLKPERAAKTPAELERRHAADLRELVAFLLNVHRGTPTLLSASSASCPRCSRRLAPAAARCVCGRWRDLPRRATASNTTTLDAVESTSVARIISGGALDAVCGGGIVASAVTLLGGQPGGGKSSILLSLAAALAEVRGRKAFFVNVEMTAGELRVAAERLGVALDRIVVLTGLGDVDVEDFGIPAAIVLDSVSSLVGRDLHAAIAIAKRLKRYASRYGVPVFIVCHIEKTGDYAGLLALQHEVDILLKLDADEDGVRTLTAVKNRFGVTHVVHHFEMTAEGLVARPPPPAKSRRRPAVSP